MEDNKKDKPGFRKMKHSLENNLTFEDYIMEKLFNLAEELSPEKLTNNWGRSVVEIDHRYIELKEQWRELESRLKREVPVEEVYLFYERKAVEEIMWGFLKLAYDLCPESLWEDGNITAAQVDEKADTIAYQWKQLEEKLGKKMSEQEIWEWHREFQENEKFSMP